MNILESPFKFDVEITNKKTFKKSQKTFHVCHFLITPGNDGTSFFHGWYGTATVKNVLQFYNTEVLVLRTEYHILIFHSSTGRVFEYSSTTLYRPC